MGHIIAIGGQGLLVEDPRLERFMVSLSRSQPARAVFLGQASGENPDLAEQFTRVFESLGCTTSVCSLFSPPSADLAAYFGEKDVICVGGGNTRSMLALWREWELDRILRDCHDSGAVLGGSSAGGNCWFEWCSTDSIPGTLTALPALGYLKGSFCPHFDSEPGRRPTLANMLESEDIPPGWAADDLAAVHYENYNFVQAVSARQGARVYRVSAPNGIYAESLEANTLQLPDRIV